MDKTFNDMMAASDAWYSALKGVSALGPDLFVSADKKNALDMVFGTRMSPTSGTFYNGLLSASTRKEGVVYNMLMNAIRSVNTDFAAKKKGYDDANAKAQRDTSSLPAVKAYSVARKAFVDATDAYKNIIYGSRTLLTNYNTYYNALQAAKKAAGSVNASAAVPAVAATSLPAVAATSLPAIAAIPTTKGNASAATLAPSSFVPITASAAVGGRRGSRKANRRGSRKANSRRSSRRH